MRPIGIQHVTVGVHDLEEAVAFYELLGMTLDPDRPCLGVEGAWMFAADQQVHIVVTAGRTPPDAATHFAVVVENLSECLDELASVGVAARRLDRIPGAGEQAFLRDPTGNVIELNQPDRQWPPVR